jgi:uncharacterized membrane protein YfcA
VELSEFAASTLVIVLGSIVQAVSGVGAGFLMVPMLAIIDLALVPGPLIFGSLALSGIMAWRERGAIDRANLAPMFTGMVPGAALGAWILSIVPAAQLGIVFALVIFVGIGMTVAGLDMRPNRINSLIAGGIAGTMGASSGIGAPMVAILYQHETGPRVRSTLALIYTTASLMIIVALAAFGSFGAAEALDGALMMPGFLFGYWLANRLRRRLELGATRPVVLGVSAAAALTLLIRSLAA